MYCLKHASDLGIVPNQTVGVTSKHICITYGSLALVISSNGSDTVAKNIPRFNYDDYSVICPKIYSSFLEEVFILDVYRTDLLRKGDLVLDLGAGTGDFCLIASKKIGKAKK